MVIKSAEFLVSNTDPDLCPVANKPEFAFVGRSNVGKSSLLNMLTGKKNLAKISSTPGKTQTINHFLINERWYLADLPGYGFARVSQTSRFQWGSMIERYLLQRENLSCTFILLDVRLPAQAKDLDFIQWLGHQHKPLALVFTKADKLSRNDLDRHVARYEQTLRNTWAELPPLFVTSATTKTGRDEILDFIGEALQRSGKAN
jgi:GTP-binding protein